MMKFWTIAVQDARLQMNMLYLQSKGECFLSANTKLSSIDKAVKLKNKELAIKYRDAIFPTIQRRHGGLVQLNIFSLQMDFGLYDDLLVISRITENQFSPNKKPATFLSAINLDPSGNF